MAPRKNKTFSRQQNIWIVTSYGEFKNPATLRREFRKYFSDDSRKAPYLSITFQLTYSTVSKCILLLNYSNLFNIFL